MGHTDQQIGRSGTIRASMREPSSHTGALTDEAVAQFSPDRAFFGQHLDAWGWALRLPWREKELDEQSHLAEVARSTRR